MVVLLIQESKAWLLTEVLFDSYMMSSIYLFKYLFHFQEAHNKMIYVTIRSNLETYTLYTKYYAIDIPMHPSFKKNKQLNTEIFAYNHPKIESLQTYSIWYSFRVIISKYLHN